MTTFIVIAGWLIILLRERPWDYGLPSMVLFTLVGYAMGAMVVPEFLAIRNPLIIAAGGWSLIAVIGWRARDPAPAIAFAVGLAITLGLSSAFGALGREGILRWAGFVCLLLIGMRFSIGEVKLGPMVVRLSRWMISFGLVLGIVFLVKAVFGGLGGDKRFQLSEDIVATGTAGIALFVLLAGGARIQSSHGREKLIYGFFVLLALYVIFQSGTRSALAIAILCLPVLFFPQVFENGLRSKGVLYGILGVVLIVGGVGVIRTADSAAGVRTFLRLDREDVFDTRRNLWEKSLASAEENPVLGKGMGSSSYLWIIARNQMGGFDSSMRGMRETVHNQYLEVLVEGGWVGLILFVAILVSAGLGAIRWLEFGLKRRHAGAVYLSLVWVCYVIGMVGHGGLTTTGNPSGILFWLTTMIMTVPPQALVAKRRKSKEMKRRRERAIIQRASI